MNKSNDELLETTKAAGFLRVAPSTLNAWRCRSEGPTYVKVGRLVKYKKADLDKFITQNTVTFSRDK